MDIKQVERTDIFILEWLVTDLGLDVCVCLCLNQLEEFSLVSVRSGWILSDGQENYNIFNSSLLHLAVRAGNVQYEGCVYIYMYIYIYAVCSCKSVLGWVFCSWSVWVWAQEQIFVWWAELQFCCCPVGGHCVSYRPSVGGSLPLEPDWARLMYRFNSFSCQWRKTNRTEDAHINMWNSTGCKRAKSISRASQHIIMHLRPLCLNIPHSFDEERSVTGNGGLPINHGKVSIILLKWPLC